MKFRVTVVLLTLLLCLYSTGLAFASVRKSVLAAAEPAFRSWITSIPVEQLDAFGFSSEYERDKARLLTPIPFLTPQRTASLDRSEVESHLNDVPVTWMVPVAVENSVACLVIVEALGGKEPEVVEFGKTFAAGRLNAAFHLLEWPIEQAGREVRFLSFVSPNIDLLLVKERGSWRWFNLLGTVQPQAVELEAAAIVDLLEQVKKIKTLPH